MSQGHHTSRKNLQVPEHRFCLLVKDFCMLPDSRSLLVIVLVTLLLTHHTQMLYAGTTDMTAIYTGKLSVTGS